MDWTAQIWSLAQPGRVAAILGAPLPSPPDGWRVVRVRGAAGAPLGALLRAREIVEQRIGGRSQPGDPLVHRVSSGIRRRLLGEFEAVDDAGPLVAELNRLADAAGRTAILVDDIDRADASTVALVRRFVESPGWLRPALLLSASRAPASGPVSELLRALEEKGQLLRAPAELPALPPGPLRVLRALAVAGGEADATHLAALLGDDPLRVLEGVQEAHDLGFPVEDRGEGRLALGAGQREILVSGLLPSLREAWRARLAAASTAPAWPPFGHAFGVDPELQQGRGEEAPAEEATAPFASGPEAPVRPAPEPIWPELGAVEEPPPAPTPVDTWPELGAPPEAPPTPAPVDTWPELGAVSAEASPSPVVAIWPELGGVEEPVPAPAPVDTWPALGAVEEPPPTPAPVDTWPALGAVEEPPPANPAANATPASDRRGAFRSPKPAAPPPASPWPELGGGARFPTAQEAPGAARPSRDEGVEALVAELLAGAGEAPTYAAPQALSQLRQALALLDRLPAAPARLVLRARVHLALGRLCWQAAGLMPGLDLEAALRELRRAERILRALPDEARLLAEERVLLASVCYDRGDAESLELALQALTEAVRTFTALGEPRTAARLLNDQAAVWVRIGDVVRAAHLLRQSRELLEGLGTTDPADRADLAETNHLLARLPLHVPSRPGRERDALRQALQHAAEAEASYEALGMGREQARTWSTRGRLHLLLDEAPLAVEILRRAFAVQERLGDALGLAQTAAALGEALVRVGEPEHAVELMSASIQLNARLGALAGLRANADSLDALLRVVPPEHPAARALKRLRRELGRQGAAEGR